MMQVATVRDGQPWCVTLVFVTDDKLNIYWVSKPDTRHSTELRDNPKIAVTIPVKLDIEGKKVGLSVEGEAVEVEDQTDLKLGVRLFADRYKTGDKWVEEFLMGRNPHKLYKLTPKMFVLFDQVNFPDEPRQEWIIQ